MASHRGKRVLPDRRIYENQVRLSVVPVGCECSSSNRCLKEDIDGISGRYGVDIFLFTPRNRFDPFKNSLARVVVYSKGEGLFLVRSVNLRNPG